MAVIGVAGCGDATGPEETEPTLDVTAARYVYVDARAGTPRLMAVNRGADTAVELSLEGAVKVSDPLDSPDLASDTVLYMSRPRTGQDRVLANGDLWEP